METIAASSAPQWGAYAMMAPMWLFSASWVCNSVYSYALWLTSLLSALFGYVLVAFNHIKDLILTSEPWAGVLIVLCVVFAVVVLGQSVVITLHCVDIAIWWSLRFIRRLATGGAGQAQSFWKLTQTVRDWKLRMKYTSEVNPVIPQTIGGDEMAHLLSGPYSLALVSRVAGGEKPPVSPESMLSNTIQRVDVWPDGLAMLAAEEPATNPVVIGLGFLLSFRGKTLLMTARHVWEAMPTREKIMVIRKTPDGKMKKMIIPAKAVYENPKLDQVGFALPPNFAAAMGLKTLMLSTQAQGTLKVFTPYSEEGQDIQLGDSLGNCEYVPKDGVFQHWASTKKGSSGSPALMGGRVIGVHVGGVTGLYNVVTPLREATDIPDVSGALQTMDQSLKANFQGAALITGKPVSELTKTMATFDVESADFNLKRDRKLRRIPGKGFKAQMRFIEEQRLQKVMNSEYSHDGERYETYWNPMTGQEWERRVDVDDGYDRESTVSPVSAAQAEIEELKRQNALLQEKNRLLQEQRKLEKESADLSAPVMASSPVQATEDLKVALPQPAGEVKQVVSLPPALGKVQETKLQSLSSSTGSTTSSTVFATLMKHWQGLRLADPSRGNPVESKSDKAPDSSTLSQERGSQPMKSSSPTSMKSSPSASMSKKEQKKLKQKESKDLGKSSISTEKH